MYLVIARKQYTYGDEIVEGEFDFDNPLATYDTYDLQVAQQHAFTHTLNRGVDCMVVREEDIPVIRKTMDKNYVMPPRTANDLPVDPQGLN